MAIKKEKEGVRFQHTVEDTLIRHKSVLDVMTKLQEGSTRVNRALAKAVTSCGCITIDAKKQQVPETASFKEIPKYTSTHLAGKLCAGCREAIETELGMTLFYLAGLCVLLGLDFEKIMEEEDDRMKALGIFSLT